MDTSEVLTPTSGCADVQLSLSPAPVGCVLVFVAVESMAWDDVAVGFVGDWPWTTASMGTGEVAVCMLLVDVVTGGVYTLAGTTTGVVIARESSDESVAASTAACINIKVNRSRYQHTRQ